VGARTHVAGGASRHDGPAGTSAPLTSKTRYPCPQTLALRATSLITRLMPSLLALLWPV
jgi:hypothetical protein